METPTGRACGALDSMTASLHERAAKLGGDDETASSRTFYHFIVGVWRGGCLFAHPFIPFHSIPSMGKQSRSASVDQACLHPCRFPASAASKKAEVGGVWGEGGAGGGHGTSLPSTSLPTNLGPRDTHTHNRPAHTTPLPRPPIIPNQTSQSLSAAAASACQPGRANPPHSSSSQFRPSRSRCVGGVNPSLSTGPHHRRDRQAPNPPAAFR